MSWILHRHSRRFSASSGGWAAIARSVMIVLIACAGCERSPGGENRDGDEALRIVSFSPALSRMVVDLGLEEHLVGRTPYCDFLDASVAVVGDLHRVDYERLVDLNPTHVLIQAPQDGGDQRLADLSDEHQWRVGQWTSINTIEDIESVLRDLPGVLMDGDDPAFADLGRTSARLLNEIALALSPGGDDTWRDDVLLVYSTEPVGVFGRQTYLNDVLVRLGASNAIELDGWPNLTLEDVVHLNPPAIVLLKPNADANIDALDQLGPLGQLDIDAVNAGHVAVLRHPAALTPSTGIIGTARELRDILRGWSVATATSESER